MRIFGRGRGMGIVRSGGGDGERVWLGIFESLGSFGGNWFLSVR